ncbi:MAG: secretin N-terminal domain-containing protein [Verrucomicrobiota bacterium]
MKTRMLSAVLVSISLGMVVALAQQPAESPQAQDAASVPTNAPSPTPPSSDVSPAPAAPEANLAGVKAAPSGETVPAAQPPAGIPPGAAPAPNPAGVEPAPSGEKNLRLNFRSVPLEMVLNYLSEAAGFIIVLETEVKGKVDVWSQQPLSKDEAVNLLNSILNKNGYAAIRNGRTLTVVSRDEAKKRDIPVRSGSNPEAIPKNDEMVTQIIPVRYANAVQMTKDLQPLLPTYANLSANESGNALVITDTQADIRRMAEIVKALDTSISSISAIRVFPLRFADAKELANVVKELFPAPGSNTGRNSNDPRAQFFSRFAGGGPGGGGPGGGGPGGGGQSGTGQSEARQAASRVTAVADERTNSLVVSAPDEVIPILEQLVKEIDTNAENITELRVFHLLYSDPVEMADMLSSLFPDESRTDSNRSAVQFRRGDGGPGGGFFGRQGGLGNTQQASERAKMKGRVMAVADQRTSSVIVSAASDLMPQIAEMIEQLDANPAKKQKVFVYSLENADVQNVEEVLRQMFEGQNSRNTRSNSRQNNNNALNNRNQSNQGSGQTGSGFSGNRGVGGTGGQGNR